MPPATAPLFTDTMAIPADGAQDTNASGSDAVDNKPIASIDMEVDDPIDYDYIDGMFKAAFERESAKQHRALTRKGSIHHQTKLDIEKADKIAYEPHRLFRRGTQGGRAIAHGQALQAVHKSKDTEAQLAKQAADARSKFDAEMANIQAQQTQAATNLKEQTDASQS